MSLRRSRKRMCHHHHCVRRRRKRVSQPSIAFIKSHLKNRLMAVVTINHRLMRGIRHLGSARSPVRSKCSSKNSQVSRAPRNTMEAGAFSLIVVLTLTMTSSIEYRGPSGSCAMGFQVLNIISATDLRGTASYQCLRTRKSCFGATLVKIGTHNSSIGR